jgi:putative Mg2+ transporter-C (MgtC) family protein
MLPYVSWQQIVLRLALAFVCAGIIGFDRDERGHTAGMRTTLLVALAACFAMIQTNLLAISTGKSPDSFVVMDIMRLPLGILSGIGFIGAGAILKRGEIVVGLTTAATLWFVTVMGLCFGGGQIGLGLAAFALGVAVLSGLKKVETEMPSEQRGTLRITVPASAAPQTEIETTLRGAGFTIAGLSIALDTIEATRNVFTWKLRWREKSRVVDVPPAIQGIAQNPAIERFEFNR